MQKYKLILISGLILFACSGFCEEVPQIPDIPEEAIYDLQLADIYAEIVPKSGTMDVIAVLFIGYEGDQPVILKLGGNVMRLSIESDTHKNICFLYRAPYLWLYNIEPGMHVLKMKYLVQHFQCTYDGGDIAVNNLQLASSSWWYPRNVNEDPHQVILYLETPPDYKVYGSVNEASSKPNNLKLLRVFVVADPLKAGLELSSNPFRKK